MTYAPIALFTYNRADKTQRVVESLLQNAEAKYSDLFIFSDGPKTSEKKAGVEENRKYIHTISGFNSLINSIYSTSCLKLDKRYI